MKRMPVLLSDAAEVHHVTMVTRPFVSYSQDENKGKRKHCRVQLYTESATEYAYFFLLHIHGIKKDKRMQITRGNMLNHIWIVTLTS
jgi:hypothetical protein